MTRRALVASKTITAAAMLLAFIGSSQDVGAAGADQGPFSGLSGSWTGAGSVVMADGSRERIRCRATYSVAAVAWSMNQGLRCASDSYVFDVRSNVTAAANGTLSGTWSEATRQVSGELTGNVSPGHIQTSVETLGFSANLTINTRGSRQSVSLQPQGTDVQAVTIEMRRG